MNFLTCFLLVFNFHSFSLPGPTPQYFFFSFLSHSRVPLSSFFFFFNYKLFSLVISINKSQILTFKTSSFLWYFVPFLSLSSFWLVPRMPTKQLFENAWFNFYFRKSNANVSLLSIFHYYITSFSLVFNLYQKCVVLIDSRLKTKIEKMVWLSLFCCVYFHNIL